MIAKGRDLAIVTKNLVPGEAVYNEKRLSVQKPGAKVLYLGAASGITVSHVSDIVGPEGCVYAVEISETSGRELVNMAKTRPNVIPIIEDARNPAKYKMLVSMVDVICADLAQPDEAIILALNASFFLKTGGHFSIIINANIHHLTARPELVFSNERKKLLADELKPSEQVTLEPFARDHAYVVGVRKKLSTTTTTL
ncbi:hypothetical protein Bca4012_010686 [Brassica carinata]|uniref:Fibrillarin n=1 Tax=Brassica carinata TaxID=52824 RepID=A0A8X7V1V3_BRACI|nr:hypothetical protein Bca52824_035601 [Brassica carinata]